MSNFNITTLEIEIGGKTVSLETGLVAKQAHGSVTARCGDTIVLATSVFSGEQKPGIADFVPLTVNYKERTYAAGKIPGGFFKRESRLSKKETLASRIIDRSLRPLFPSGYSMETGVMAMVLSADGENDPEMLAVLASSASLLISSIPFHTPISAVRVGRLDGNYIINPKLEDSPKCDIELVVAGTLDGILMVEGGAKEVDEDTVIKVLETAKPEIDRLCNFQLELQKKAGVKKMEFTPETLPQDVVDLGNSKYRSQVADILNAFHDKATRDVKTAELKAAFTQEITEKYADNAATFAGIEVENLFYEESRRMVIERNVRADGRKPEEIRALDSRIGILPRAHGSALFTRGQTQGLVVTTLGTAGDAQMVEGLGETYDETFMLHYNFPGFSTGEVKPDRAPGRREIGHGELARRALLPLIPEAEKFPYTIRVVSDIMESNGSSSMASVCGGSLSLFDAGVPMKAACSGIAMGLIKEGDKYVVLSDIMGLEDHLGDMDFKVTGSRNGVTAFQMDVKLASGISIDILKQAIAQATRGRMHIMEHMESVIKEPKANISKYAPTIFTMTIPQDKIGALIGPGGKNIKKITEETGAKIDINDDGVVQIATNDAASLEAAKAAVELITAEVELNKIYKGKVVSIQPFGAFVELIPGKDGLLHISEIDKKRINKVEDVLKMGDIVEVKVVEIDNNGKVRLSRKVLL